MLSAEDRESIRFDLSYGCGCIGNEDVSLCDSCSFPLPDLLTTVESIVIRHVNEALEAAADDVLAAVSPHHPSRGYRDGTQYAAFIVRARATQPPAR